MDDTHITARTRARITPHDGTSEPGVSAPVRLIAARRHLAADGSPRLTVLVDRFPSLDELTYRPIDIGHVRPLPPLTLYIGTHPDGLVMALVDIGDQRGFYGQTMRLRLTDGIYREVTGPYLAGPDLIDVFAAHLRVRADVAVTDDPDSFARHRDGRDTLRAGLTAPVAEAALRLAIRQGLTERGTPTRASADLDPQRFDGGRR